MSQLKIIDTSFSFDPEVYPIGIVPSWAVVIGLSQTLVHTSYPFPSSGIPYLGLRPKVCISTAASSSDLLGPSLSPYTLKKIPYGGPRGGCVENGREVST